MGTKGNHIGLPLQGLPQQLNQRQLTWGLPRVVDITNQR